ncbi:sucrose transporter GRMZM2G083248 [Zea mays]|uniref:Sucrose transporter GRMZM2G083248 n=1 Tax=Zea mays TaxID=4577 RepID=A0A1D6KVS1_MAIZE|nr:sucrose transporter GRMZM2G083248 [Zea mays]
MHGRRRRAVRMGAAALPSHPLRPDTGDSSCSYISHVALWTYCWLTCKYLHVQPCVGLYSDKCTSKLGRRRPFIFTGCIIICISVIVIGFSSDIGYALGDTTEDCNVYTGKRLHAALFFVMGFWLLDFSNNTVQGPARALMADLAGSHGPSTANAIFVSWMAIGNILGYSSGSTDKWHTWFPFLQTRACCEACANLKAAFLVTVLSSWSLGDIGGNVQDAAAVDKGLKTTALAIFVFLGFPFAVLCSVPFAVTAQLAAAKGGGQGLCTGVLNISIVVPQMVIAIGSGPWDELFGKGNIPAFGLAAVFAFTAAVAGIIMLPKQPKTSFRSVSMGGGH